MTRPLLTLIFWTLVFVLISPPQGLHGFGDVVQHTAEAANVVSGSSAQGDVLHDDQLLGCRDQVDRLGQRRVGVHSQVVQELLGQILELRQPLYRIEVIESRYLISRHHGHVDHEVQSDILLGRFEVPQFEERLRRKAGAGRQSAFLVLAGRTSIRQAGRVQRNRLQFRFHAQFLEGHGEARPLSRDLQFGPQFVGETVLVRGSHRLAAGVLVLLDEQGLHAPLRQESPARDSARPASDDDDVVLLVGHYTPLGYFCLRHFDAAGRYDKHICRCFASLKCFGQATSSLAFGFSVAYH